MSEKKLSLTEHLIEIRARLIRSLVVLGVSVVCTLYFSKEIFSWLQRPLLDVLPSSSSFITTNPVEPMIIYLKVSLLAGLFLSSPFIFYQLWRFISPGLFPGEKKIAFSFVLFSTLFFVGGGLFGYFVIFPIGFRFFVALLVGTDIQLLPHMREYLGFISKMLLTFGLVFEMPVLLTLLARVGLVTRDQLKKARRYVIVLSFLIAGLLTPGPDIFSQLLLALPLLVLYEISLLAIWVLGKKEMGS